MRYCIQNNICFGCAEHLNIWGRSAGSWKQYGNESRNKWVQQQQLWYRIKMGSFWVNFIIILLNGGIKKTISWFSRSILTAAMENNMGLERNWTTEAAGFKVSLSAVTSSLWVSSEMRHVSLTDRPSAVMVSCLFSHRFIWLLRMSVKEGETLWKILLMGPSSLQITHINISGTFRPYWWNTLLSLWIFSRGN